MIREWQVEYLSMEKILRYTGTLVIVMTDKLSMVHGKTVFLPHKLIYIDHGGGVPLETEGVIYITF